MTDATSGPEPQPQESPADPEARAFIVRALEYVEAGRRLPRPGTWTELLAGMVVWLGEHWSDEVERPFDAIAELRVRHSELKSISERLDHVATVSRARKWEVRSQLALGALGAGLIGVVPFATAKPSLIASVVYGIVLAGALYLSWTYSKAAQDVGAERVDSILAIKEHIDTTMLKTDTPRLQAPTRRLGPASAPREPTVEAP
jgi:hypothetical protein